MTPLYFSCVRREDRAGPCAHGDQDYLTHLHMGMLPEEAGGKGRIGGERLSGGRTHII